MAQQILEGSESVEGMITNMYDLASIEESNMIRILEESDGFLIGTPTINADAPKPVWDLLSCLMFLDKSSKCAGAFGSYGWSGEAPKHITKALEEMKFQTFAPVSVQFAPNHESLKKCVDLGREIGAAIKQSSKA